MTEEEDRDVEHHLRAALRHLEEAQDGDLRRTNAAALRQVADTVATVLRERERDA